MPLLCGLGLFVALLYGLLPLRWLMLLQLGLWLLLPFALFLTPRYPRLGFLLPETLRVVAQTVFALLLPFAFWQLGYYIAFAASIAVVCYILWMDSAVDEMP